MKNKFAKVMYQEVVHYAVREHPGQEYYVRYCWERHPWKALPQTYAPFVTCMRCIVDALS